MADTRTLTHDETEPPPGAHAVRGVEAKVRWADEDANGHVNNAVYLNYLEEARDALLDGLFGASSFDFVLAHLGIDYVAEITHRHHVVSVDSWVTGHGTSSVRTAEVIRLPDGSLAARSVAVLVPRGPDGGSRPLSVDEIAAVAGG
jgi:acyl-CoA thioester hydrolase